MKIIAAVLRGFAALYLLLFFQYSVLQGFSKEGGGGGIQMFFFMLIQYADSL